MDPQLNLKGLFDFVGAWSGIAFFVAIVALFVSHARWGTFKHMFLVWVTVFLSGTAMALVAGPLFHSHLLVQILTSVSWGVASVVAVVMGVRYVRKAHRSEAKHTPLAINLD